MHATTTLILLIVLKCVDGAPYYQIVNQCPRGYKWNDLSRQCDVVKPKTTASPKYNYLYENDVTGNGISRPVYVPHDKTREYYASRNNQQVKMQRKKGFAFNPNTNCCEYHPSATRHPDVPYLAPKLRSAMSTGNTPNGCPHDVDPYNPVHLPHPDCSKYYECTTSGPVERRCAEGLHWSRALNRCDQYWRAGCQQGDYQEPAIAASTISSLTMTATTISTARSTTETSSIYGTTENTRITEDIMEETTDFEDYFTTEASE